MSLKKKERYYEALEEIREHMSVIRTLEQKKTLNHIKAQIKKELERKIITKLNQAKERIKRGDLLKAENELAKILKAFPTHREALLLHDQVVEHLDLMTEL